MKQVTQILRDGTIEVVEVPIPSLRDDFVLVRNHASVISAGTEKTKIDMGRKSLLQKARARPDLVRQVMRKIRTEGLRKTLQTVNTRLDSLSALGYSCAGEVIAVGGRVKGVRPGDRVACGGADHANHAEIVAVPRNLVVAIPPQVTYEEGCFATVGAIALQGLRLADPKIGETFLVIGLGLLGQIAVQLLRASGCRVIGSDLAPELVDRAERTGAMGVREPSSLAEFCRLETRGYGVDGVLVCAGSSSNSIIESCGEVTRDKGRVVVVGAVRMDIPREPFFRKEIQVVISRSYGPGRYDPEYEDKGNDYPYGYVRFSEQRNMETVIQLIADRKLDVSGLVTHSFPVERAAEAYAVIEGQRREPYLGIVLKYGREREAESARVPASPVREGIRVSFFGAGNYATASLLPLLVNAPGVGLQSIVTASGRTAEAVARKFGFAQVGGQLAQVVDADTDVLVIASRHDSHAATVVSALEASKHVYVEKPLALSMPELRAVRAALAAAPDRQLMVGFNRRFAPATRMILAHLADVPGPRIISIRVNAGTIPRSHWIQDPVAGGGRIIGEACHFVDLAATLAGSLPSTVHAVAALDASAPLSASDNVVVSLAFANGSVASITYVASGSRAMSKEYVEVFAGGRSAVIDDFRRVQLFSGDSSARTEKLGTQDKGQASMVKEWLDGLRSGVPCVDSPTLLAVSAATILAVESLCIGMPLDIDGAFRETQVGD